MREIQCPWCEETAYIHPDTGVDYCKECGIIEGEAIEVSE